MPRVHVPRVARVARVLQALEGHQLLDVLTPLIGAWCSLALGMFWAQ